MSVKERVRGPVSWARMRAWLGLALMTVAAAAVAGFMIGHSVGRHGSTPAGVDVSGLPAYVDREMAAQAARDGRPFLYQLRDGPVPCWPRLRMPDGRTYGMEQARDADAGVAPRAGYIQQYGCELPEVAAQLPPR